MLSNIELFLWKEWYFYQKYSNFAVFSAEVKNQLLRFKFGGFRALNFSGLDLEQGKRNSASSASEKQKQNLDFLAHEHNHHFRDYSNIQKFSRFQ